MATEGPLAPGDYTGSVTGFSGAFALSGQSVTVTNNITGAGVTGCLYSTSSVSGAVSFTVQ